MKPIWMLALGLALFVAGAAVSQEMDPEKMKKMTPEERKKWQEEAMARWMKAMKPGPAHEKLAAFIGTWDTEMKMWMQPGKPMVTKGEAECRWLMKGRWIVREGTGSFMGKTVKSFGIVGYDNFKQKYVTCDVNDMETHMLTSTGNWTPDGKALVTYGKMDEPMTGEVGKTVKYVWKLIGPDEHVLEIHDLAIGLGNTKVIEMTYRRRK